MKTRTYDVYADPGHAWMRVPRAHLIELGILSQITHYSYQRGDWVYLEEDQDISTLMRAMAARGVAVKYREHHTDRASRIRGYCSFRP